MLATLTIIEEKTIEQRILENYDENPLIYWEKSKPIAKIELKDYSKEINCKPYPYTHEDKEKFIMHIKEMKKCVLLVRLFFLGPRARSNNIFFLVNTT